MIRITIDSDERCEGKTALAGLIHSFLMKMGYNVDVDATFPTKQCITNDYDHVSWAQFDPRDVTIVDRA